MKPAFQLQSPGNGHLKNYFVQTSFKSNQNLEVDFKTASQLLIAETFKAEMSLSDTLIFLTMQFLVDDGRMENGNVNMEDINPTPLPDRDPYILKV